MQKSSTSPASLPLSTIALATDVAKTSCILEPRLAKAVVREVLRKTSLRPLGSRARPVGAVVSRR
jgi:hypothetical protein